MTTRLELKTSFAASAAGEITGNAWPFNSADRFGDMITKGAFANTETPLPVLFGHDPNDVVGVWDHVAETDDGLEVKGRLFLEESARAREVHAFLTSGAVKGLSIGFFVRKAAPRKGGGRIISDLGLQEISIVTIPAHPGARLTGAKTGVRALQLAGLINRATAARLTRKD